MKHIYFLLIVAFAFCSTAWSQKLGKNKIPAIVMESFNQKYPGIGGKWAKENSNFEVNFKKDGRSMSAVLNDKGAILETENDMAVKDLPASVLAYIAVHYKGAKIKEAAQIIKADGHVIYEAQVNHVDVLFDKEGKFFEGVKD